jgi:hypothetical protein
VTDNSVERNGEEIMTERLKLHNEQLHKLYII